MADPATLRDPAPPTPALRRKVNVFFTPARLSASGVEGRAAVVIDVLRATSSMVEALANGARAVFPTESIEHALELHGSLDREGTLLCGERRSLPIDGFDLGNSPSEFAKEVVADKQLIMTTTNGTRAFLATRGADRILAASFLNLGAVVDALAGDRRIVVVCAGKEGRFSLDDAVCAGHLVRRLLAEGGDDEAELDDSALAAAQLASDFEPSKETFGATAAGRALVEVGLGGDLALCAAVDRHAIVPVLHDRAITVGRD